MRQNPAETMVPQKQTDPRQSTRYTGSSLKRLVELVLAAGVLAYLSPLLLAIAVLIRAESPGPVFFRQLRLGREGSVFRIWKFRSMIHRAWEQGAGMLVERNDPRITRVGRWLRRLSLDEVPQLFNIVCGEMSLVGPRPALIEHAREYAPWQRRRLEVRPGITGWAQIHGRNELSWPQRIGYDVWYVDHRSFWLDLYILARTLRVVVKGEGIYTDELGKFRVRIPRVKTRSGAGYVY